MCVFKESSLRWFWSDQDRKALLRFKCKETLLFQKRVHFEAFLSQEVQIAEALELVEETERYNAAILEERDHAVRELAMLKKKSRELEDDMERVRDSEAALRESSASLQEQVCDHGSSCACASV